MKNKAIFIVMILFLFITGALRIHNGEAKPQDPDTRETEIETLERAVTLLEDTDEMKKIVDNLKAVIDAKKQIEQREEKREQEIPVLIKIQSYIKNTTARLRIIPHNISLFFHDIQTTYGGFKNYLKEKRNTYTLINIATKLFVSILIGLILWIISRKAAMKITVQGQSVRQKPSLTVPEKLYLNVLDSIIEILPLVIVFLFIYFLLKLLNPPEQWRVAMLYCIGIILIYKGALIAINSIINTRNEKIRVVPLSDEHANYIFIWARRIFLFSAVLFFLIKAGETFHMAQSIVKGLSVILKVGLAYLFTIISFQQKDFMKRVFSLSVKEEEAQWRRTGKYMLNMVLEYLYIMIACYVFLLAILSIAGLTATVSFLIGASLKSIGALLIAFVIFLLWHKLFDKFFEIGDLIKRNYPELEKQANQYISFLGKSIDVLIGVITCAFILDIWGIEVQKFLFAYSDYLFRLIRIPLAVLSALLVIQCIKLFIRKVELQFIEKGKQEGVKQEIEVEKEIKTIGGIIQKFLVIMIWTVIIIMIIKDLGFNIAPLLAGFSVVGVAIGLGAQNIVKDVISGLFLILENQVRVGDVAILNGTGGLVEAINLRTMVLRGLDGTVHVFPNGSINSLSNMTHNFSYYLFEIGVAYKEDMDHVIDVLKKISDDILQDNVYKDSILEPLEILGVDKFADSAIIIKARIKTLPIHQWKVGREMNKRIKKRFDDEGIEIPFPHRTFYFGEVSKPVKVEMEREVDIARTNSMPQK
ncbi:MAG: mechanosensitive ion channel family protein [bacterium]